MERNKYFFLAAILLFSARLLCDPADLAAQDPGYFIDYSGLKPRIIQKLAWNIEENAMHYEVAIDMFANENEPYEFSKTITADNYLDVYLTPGKYRYNVTAFDYLGRPGEPSEWINFEIITAYHPVVEQFSPDVFFLDQNKKRELIVSGNNLSLESTIRLRNPRHDLLPVGVSIINDDKLKISFDDEKLVPGYYEIYAVNPGGLESVIGGFTVKYRKFFDIFLKTAYTPVIPLYGTLKENFPSSMYSAGFTAAVEFISSYRTEINTGLEFSYSAYMLNSFVTIDSGLDDAWYGLFNNNGMAFNDFDFNVSVQKRFNKRKMAFTFRFGCGLSFINDAREMNTDYMEYGGEGSNHLNIHLNLGLSYLILIHNIFYLDFGADFNHHITEGESGTIKPKLALVWKF